MGSVIIISGGLDSTVLLHYLVKRLKLKRLYAITFNYGQKLVKELECAKWQCKQLGVPHTVINISSISPYLRSALTTSNIKVPHGNSIKSKKQTIVPNRNMILLSIAVAYAVSNNCNEVYYAAHASDVVYPDCTSEFVSSFKRAVYEATKWTPVEIKAPFLFLTKTGIVALGNKLGVDFSKTWSCYKGGKKPCGKCPTCIERKRAFKECGLIDPLEGGENCV